MPMIFPNFASETEEADWWYEHRAEVEAEFLIAAAEGQLKQRQPNGDAISVAPLSVPAADLQAAKELLRRSEVWSDDAPVIALGPNATGVLRKAS